MYSYTYVHICIYMMLLDVLDALCYAWARSGSPWARSGSPTRLWRMIPSL